MGLKMRFVLVIYILVLVLLLTQAKQEDEVQKPEITKLEIVDLGESEVEPNSEQSDVQRKRNTGYIYKSNRISSSTRLRFPEHQSRDQIASKFPGQLNRPFTKYGPPNHSTSGPITQGYHAQQHRNKLQYHVSQQQSSNFNDGLIEQEIPSPIRNVDFVEMNPIASQNNEPFGMHTANYLPPQNQKLPAYSSTDNFVPQSSQSPLNHGANSQNQNLVHPVNQISDAALFLYENAQAIQQLYGAPANNQDFAPNNNQFQGTSNQIPNQNSQFRDFESTSQDSQEFRGSLPSYASGTLNQETLEQIQSFEKDRLIVQLQQALAQTQTTLRPEAVGRYAQNQASFIQNQELLKLLSQQTKSQIPMPQTAAFASENTAFSQSPFLPGTTVNPLKGFSFNYGGPTTTPLVPTTTVGEVPITPSPQSSKNDDTTQTASSQPGSAVAGSLAGIPVYGGFVPTFIAGTNLAPSYSTSIFTPVKPAQSSDTSPTHFGIPIPTEPSQKPGLAPSIPATMTPSASANQPGAVFTPVTLPVQSIRPIATPLHPLTSVHPVVSPLLPANPVPVYPAQVSPAVTSSVQHTYGTQTALINPVLYKPVKAVYPVYYYPNVAYQLQKPALPNYPWNYAPSYPQTKPTQIMRRSYSLRSGS
ncbi:uncharacterized protein LOC114932246 [Nylanderia fulva]|uniref:uncharacterized protein LOC114932246 n=1 Tax=Nylanderia fulva TaxID=613905 RepID=UPI0010FB2909|nr:uncharacterized protein LOC114932246 [Nylanderia fulva]